MYLLSQEIEVWYIIPALRKELSRLLTEKHGLTFEKAGNILGITKAAISQYLSNKRANKIKLNSEVKKEIVKSAKIMSENPSMSVSEMQRLIRFMKENKCSCEVCKKYNKDVLKYCNCEPK